MASATGSAVPVGSGRVSHIHARLSGAELPGAVDDRYDSPAA